MKKFWLAFLLATIPCDSATAQTSSTPPSVPPQATPADGYESAHSLELYRESQALLFMNDFANLRRYHDANAALAAPAPGEQRIVFFGDSITDAWNLDRSFPGRHYINRGIGGQTTPQMLLRVRPDVVDLHAAVVVILAGTNDIAGNTGAMTLDQIESNYASIADVARAHGVRVVFSSVLPINDYTPTALRFFLQRSPEKILALNTWLRNYCAANHLVYLDYFPALVDGQGLLRKELSQDGLHPNEAGYAIMAPLAQAAIDRALAAPVP